MKTMMLSSMTLSVLLLSGCVTKGTHELTLQELDQTRNALSEAQQTIGTQEAYIAEQKALIEGLRSSVEEQQIKINEQQARIGAQELLISEQQSKIADQQNRIDEQLAQIEANKAELSQGYGELKSLEEKKAAMQRELEAQQLSLQESQQQLETLKQIEAETNKRNEIYASFISKLQNMIDGGQLTVSIDKGRIVINLPENVLFASGSATVNKEGRGALKQVAALLSEFSDRRFQVEGHTDNIPIKTSRYPSNWELSTARALSVVHLMTEEGVAPQNVSAAGFGEFQPRADNATPEGRSLNRRIEIIMLPNLEILSSELPKLAD